VDTTRLDALGFFGGAAETPNIDALLAGALVLRRHHSCSGWTYPSMVCAGAGRSALDMGYLIEFETLRGVPEDATLPSDQLRARGWRTGLVTSNPYFGGYVGFDEHFGAYREQIEAPGDVVTAEALDLFDGWAGDDPARPWLLHVHYFDPHSPYAPPAGWADTDDLDPIPFNLDLAWQYAALAEQWPGLSADAQALILTHLERRYLGELAFLDDQLGRLFEAVAAADPGAAVVLLADHGEQFWEHGAFGHGASLHREENSALAAIRWPGEAPGGWDEATTHQDIWPTLFDRMGMPRLPGFTGQPVGLAHPERPIQLLRIQVDRAQAGLVVGDEKLLYTWGDGAEQVQLYDLAADPEERDDRAGAEPERAAALLEALGPTVQRAIDLGAPAR
jgi:arylsulfatase A-like enzyme